VLTAEEQRRTAPCNVLSDPNKEVRKRASCVFLRCDVVFASERRSDVQFPSEVCLQIVYI